MKHLKRKIKIKHEVKIKTTFMIKLGDLVEKILYITGIKWLYQKLFTKGKECDECKKRKEYLNKYKI